jgi:hypothetical protein
VSNIMIAVFFVVVLVALELDRRVYTVRYSTGPFL